MDRNNPHILLRRQLFLQKHKHWPKQMIRLKKIISLENKKYIRVFHNLPNKLTDEDSVENFHFEI